MSDRPTPSEALTKIIEGRNFPLEAYYYSFDPTGNDAIDRILMAVAWAGKAYHHTDMWNDDSDFGSNGEPTPVDMIQAAANEAAQKEPAP